MEGKRGQKLPRRNALKRVAGLAAGAALSWRAGNAAAQAKMSKAVQGPISPEGWCTFYSPKS